MMLMIKTHNGRQDEDKNCDYCQRGFSFQSYEAQTRRMKKCANPEEIVYALTSISGQRQDMMCPPQSLLANGMPTYQGGSSRSSWSC